jgi:hypothetical protein
MTPKMKKAEMRAYIDARARELAASGKHHNWQSIETALRFGEGVEEAREILDRKWFQDYLDQLCHAAQRRVQEQLGVESPDSSPAQPE